MDSRSLRNSRTQAKKSTVKSKDTSSRSETLRSFQFSLSEDSAFQKLKVRIDGLVQVARQTSVTSSISLSESVAPIRTGSTESEGGPTFFTSDMRSNSNSSTSSSISTDSGFRRLESEKSEGFNNLALWEEELTLHQVATTSTKDDKRTLRGGKKDKKIEQENAIQTEFSCTASQLTSIPTDIGKLTWIKYLNFENNALTSICKEISQLFLLDTLIISHNRLSSLPIEIGELSKLKMLLADNNLLTSLPRTMGQNLSLQTLDVSFNQLAHIPTELSACAELQILNLSENPLIFPPKNILVNPPKDILAFLRETLSGTKPCEEMKLVFLGAEQSGKTTLLRALKKKTKKEQNAARGLDIGSWKTTFEITKEDASKQKVSASFATFDCSGKDNYAAAYRQFLSDNGIFIIVWDLTKNNQLTVVDYWLNMLKLKAPNAPAIIVGTHTDDKIFELDPEGPNKLVEHFIEEFGSRFPNIKSVVTCSPLNGKGIDFLRSTIEGVTMQHPNFRESIAAKYMALKDVVLQERKKRTPPVIPFKGFLSLASICGIETESGTHRAINFLSNLGVVLYIQDNSKESSDNIVLLDPEWIFDCITTLVINTTGNVFDGVFSHFALETIWNEIPANLRNAVLFYVEKLHVAYLLPREPTLDFDSSVIPPLLSAQAPRIDLPDDNRLDRIYEFEFVPPALFNSLMIRILHFHLHYNAETTGDFWRTGVVMKDAKNNYARVELLKNFIRLSVRGTRPEPLMRSLCNTLDLLLENHFHVKAKQQVVCNECAKEDVDDMNLIHLYLKEECEIAAIEGKTELTCSKQHTVNVSTLIPDILLVDKNSLKMDYEKMEIKHVLGKGAFGEIKAASLGENLVALKQLVQTSNEETLKNFREWEHEVDVMSSMNHQGLVKLQGFCVNPFGIIMELVPHGTLYDYLNNQENKIDWDMRLKIATDIAEAMSYMHSLSPPFVHRDLKTPNILLASLDPKAPVVAKVADFGLTTPLYITDFRTRLVDQPLWLAPEVMLGNSYSDKADVYAYGIILWELIARQRPFDEFPFANWFAQLEDSIVAGTRPSLPSNCHPMYRKLITDCWHSSPKFRPSFTTIVSTLQSIKQAIIEEATGAKSTNASSYHYDLPDTEETIVKEEYGKNHQQITREATLGKLIEKLTSEQSKEFDFITEFLITMTMFTKPSDILPLILSRFVGPPANAVPLQKLTFQKEKKIIQMRVLRILCKVLSVVDLDNEDFRVIKQFSADHLGGSPKFETNSPPGSPSQKGLMPQMEMMKSRSGSGVAMASLTFKDTTITSKTLSHIQTSPGDFGKYEMKLKAKLPGRLGYRKESFFVKLPRRRPSHVSTTNLADMNPIVVAEQWLLLETNLLRSIRGVEFLGQSWTKEGKEINARNILGYIEWFTQTKNWISTEILKGESSQERSVLIDIFIQIAMKFFELQNFNGIMEILASLHSDGISDLHQSWKEIPKKSHDNLTQLSALMAPIHNFKAYRNVLNGLKSTQPHLPYLGVFLTDLIFMDETSTWKHGELINFDKVRKIGGMIKQFLKVQKKARGYEDIIRPNKKIQDYLLHAEIWEEADIIRLSKLREEVDKTKQETTSYAERQGYKNIVTGRGNIATDIEQLSQREWDLIMTNASVVSFKQNDVIFYEGSVNNNLYRVKKGKFRIEKTGKDGMQMVLTTLGPSAMFGEMSFLGTKTSASVIADENKAELYMLEIGLVKRMFASDPDLFRTFYQYLATILAKRLKNASAPPSPKPPESPRPKPEEEIDESEKRKNGLSRPEDTQFRKRFGLDDSEIIIKQYPCVHNHVNGTVYLSKQHICFYSQVFGLKKKKAYPLLQVKAVSKPKKVDIELFTAMGKKFRISFNTPNMRDEAFDILDSLWVSCHTNLRGNLKKFVPQNSSTRDLASSTNSSQSTTDNEDDIPIVTDPETLSSDDWEILLQGAKKLVYSKNQPIVVEGEQFQRIYQIVRGICRIEKNGKVLGRMEEDQSFGEISFLLSGGASASVTADSDVVEIYLLEGYYINILFGIHPEMAGRFYKYMATTLQGRIRTREEERK